MLDSYADPHPQFQLQGSKVFRSIRVPTTYSFTHIHQLICFVFGWHETVAHCDRHQWKLVKEITEVRGREGEIKTSRDWIELLPSSQLPGEDEEDDESFDRRIEDEDKWTLSQVWGAGGVFTERGVIYVCVSRR